MALYLGAAGCTYAQPAAPAQPAAQKQDTLAALRELKGLLDDGTLTQEEFDAQKKVMLGRREEDI